VVFRTASPNLIKGIGEKEGRFMVVNCIDAAFETEVVGVA